MPRPLAAGLVQTIVTLSTIAVGCSPWYACVTVLPIAYLFSRK